MSLALYMDVHVRPLLSRAVFCCATWTCSLPNWTMRRNWTIPICWIEHANGTVS